MLLLRLFVLVFHLLWQMASNSKMCYQNVCLATGWANSKSCVGFHQPHGSKFSALTRFISPSMRLPSTISLYWSMLWNLPTLSNLALSILVKSSWNFYPCIDFPQIKLFKCHTTPAINKIYSYDDQICLSCSSDNGSSRSWQGNNNPHPQKVWWWCRRQSDQERNATRNHGRFEWQRDRRRNLNAYFSNCQPDV